MRDSDSHKIPVEKVARISDTHKWMSSLSTAYGQQIMFWPENTDRKVTNIAWERASRLTCLFPLQGRQMTFRGI